MCGAARRLIRSRVPQSGVELAAATQQMRTYLDALIPVAESATSHRPQGDSARIRALISTGEARRRLNAGPRSLSAKQYAVSLAQLVEALCGLLDRLAARRDG
jgi:hypothetical protein